MVASKPNRPAQGWAHPHATWLLPAYMAFVLSVVMWRLQQTSTPLPVTSSPATFSEARARQHLDVFAEVLVDRQVSMPGLQAATEYVTEQLHLLKGMAVNRADVEVQVHKHTVSGAVGMTFTHIPFTNAYRSLDNMALVITPKGTEHLKALLIASHYDSAVCSQGASDDASQASVMLEAARVLLSRANLPFTPVVFLWTGGEEPISPAAHGWSSQSPLYSKLGAFVNLEAMGGGGMPIMFQHTGSWVLKAYAQGCHMPRGSRVAQDIFDLHIIPADSDFRMFSARHYGSLPGIDIAFVLDSTAYHSYLDAPARVKPGVMQEMGEGLLGGLFSVSQELASRQKQPVNGFAAHAADGQSAVRQDQALQLEEAKQLSVYWDFLGYFMVVYSDELAHRLHYLPAVLLASTPLLMYPPYGSSSKVLTWQAYRVMCMGAVYAFASILLSVGLPIALGCVRTLLSDKPMVWFANHWLGHLQFLPIALAGALLPWTSTRQRAQAATLFSEGQYMALLLQGCGFTTSMVGVLLTVLGMIGNATLFVMNAIATFVVSWLASTQQLWGWRMAAMLATCFIPMTVGSSVVALFLEVMMERMALAGYVHAVLGDTIVGALSGLGVLAATCGVFLPLLAQLLRPGSKRWVLGGLVSISLGAAILSAAYYPAYLPDAPKRVIITQLIQTRAVDGAGNGAGAGRDGGVVVVAPETGGVAMQVVRQAVSVAGADSTMIEKVINMSAFKQVDVSAYTRAYMPLYPLDTLLHGILVEVPDASTVLPIDRQQRYGSVNNHLHPCSSNSNTQGSSDGNSDTQSGSNEGVGSSNTNSDGSVSHVISSGSGSKSSGSKDMAGRGITDSPQPCTHGALLQEVPHPEVLVSHMPFIQLTSIELKPEQQQVRLHLRMYSQLPCWGILNVTSPNLKAWSFTPYLSPGLICEACQTNGQQHMVRFTTQDADPYWPFWLELEWPAASQQGGKQSKGSSPDNKELGLPLSQLKLQPLDGAGLSGSDGHDADGDSGITGSGGKAWEDVMEQLRGMQLRIEMSVQYLQRTPALRRVLSLLPEHTAETWLATAYQSFWEL